MSLRSPCYLHLAAGRGFQAGEAMQSEHSYSRTREENVTTNYRWLSEGCRLV